MELTPFNVWGDKNSHPSQVANASASRALKSNTCSATSSASKKSKKCNPLYPYLTNDKVQMLSRVTERKFIHKKTTDFVSSFPLAVNIYKASSDQLKTVKKAKRKVKKCVHTLPNDPAPAPHMCTVSDMNDSEYCEKSDITKPRTKKRNQFKTSRKARARGKDLAYYDHDDLYCSKLNISFDESTSDMLKHYNGDVKRRNKHRPRKLQKADKNVKPQDVWAALRNVNRFQFVQSPPVSVGDLVTIEKRSPRKYPNRKDRRVIETCCTEEFAYISSYEVEDSNSHTLSQSSSYDRVTVIDKDDDFNMNAVLNKPLDINKSIKNPKCNNKIQNSYNIKKDVSKAIKNVEHKQNGIKLHLKGNGTKPNNKLQGNRYNKRQCYGSSDTGSLSETSDNSDDCAPVYRDNIRAKRINNLESKESFLPLNNSGSSKAGLVKKTEKPLLRGYREKNHAKGTFIVNSKSNLKSEKNKNNSLRHKLTLPENGCSFVLTNAASSRAESAKKNEERGSREKNNLKSTFGINRKSNLKAEQYEQNSLRNVLNVPEKDCLQHSINLGTGRTEVAKKSEKPMEREPRAKNVPMSTFVVNTTLNPIKSENNKQISLKHNITVPENDCLLYSNNLGSSRAEFPRKKDTKKSADGISREKNNSNTFIDNSTKPNLKLEKNKQNLLMRKLTLPEIKTMLSHLKFTTVVLKQYSPGIQVVEYDPPQSNAQAKNIWPFMTKWSDNKYVKETQETPKRIDNYAVDTKPKPIKTNLDLKLNKKHNPDLKIHMDTQKRYEEKKYIAYDVKSSNKRSESIQQTKCNTFIKPLQSNRPKSIAQLRDDTVNLLYKNTSTKNIATDSYHLDDTQYTDEITSKQKADITTKIKLGLMALNSVLKKRAAETNGQLVSPSKIPPTSGRPFAKAKWTNEFIENVIRKIKNGVYYTQDIIDGLSYKPLTNSNSNEIGTQVGPTLINIVKPCMNDLDNINPRIILRKKSEVNIDSFIPGFNNSLPALEIKTLNKSQIAVRNCLTNVMVQFDITVPINTTKVRTNKQPTLVPIEVTESNTRIYKCKTTILNAMLPAEICSILPKMMNNVIGFNVKPALPSVYASKKDSVLSTISEQANSEPKLKLNCLPSYIRPSLEMIYDGTFSKILNNLSASIRPEMSYQLKYESLSELDLLAIDYPRPLLTEGHSFLLELKGPKLLRKTETCNPVAESTPHCTALDVYCVQNKRTVLAFQPFNIANMIFNVLESRDIKIDLKLSSYIDKPSLQEKVNIDVTVTNDKGTENLVVKVTNLDVKSIFKSFQCTPKNSSSVKCIEYNDNSLANSTKRCVTAKTKNKRKGFYKLYRKCKSTTNIAFNDKVSTPLNKVTNLEEFFQIFGSTRMLSSVFDDCTSKKILTSVMEMKNWINEINSQQAMLILLLTNKKDTPNLVRFRPILLQGIAVNRITRANELDMEIEVIEREQFHKFSQYQGVSYAPETVENYDNLLEELYWIAKTTASDYQRPFDESSEKLLKSLLEKRKKLNPSYLRVMARYVGLGLLKSPVKR